MYTSNAFWQIKKTYTCLYKDKVLSEHVYVKLTRLLITTYHNFSCAFFTQKHMFMFENCASEEIGINIHS